MSNQKTQQARALYLLKARGALRQRDFVADGIGPETLSRMVRADLVLRPSRGLYLLRNANVHEAHVLAEVTLLVPKAIVCLVSALQFHGLTLQMPSTAWIAIERGARRPKFDYPSVRFVRFSGAALNKGVIRHRIDGIDVAVTDPARTVVDCFRYRTKVGIDIAMEGLREGLRQHRFTPDELWKYAQTSRAWSVMRPYVEAMASDDG